MKTTNEGVSWKVQIFSEFEKLNSIFFSLTNVGYSVGKRGKILRSTNSGENWDVIPFISNTELLSVFFLNEEVGYASSLINTYKTTNSGLNWALIYPLGGWDLQFTDSLTGYNAGGNGNIVKTTNGGINWFVQNMNVSGETYGICFVNSENGYGVTISGQISKTTNGGITWIPQNTISGNSFKSVYFTGSDNGYIVGNFGAILKTTNGGLVFTESYFNSVPTDFLLSQNFPNPFNSSTLIKYHIKNYSKVRLKLYNVEGKELLTLIKDYKSAGSYEVFFNANQLNSGIYFYSLYVNDELKETKKLLLIK